MKRWGIKIDRDAKLREKARRWWHDLVNRVWPDLLPPYRVVEPPVDTDPRDSKAPPGRQTEI